MQTRHGLLDDHGNSSAYSYGSLFV